MISFLEILIYFVSIIGIKDYLTQKLKLFLIDIYMYI